VALADAAHAAAHASGSRLSRRHRRRVLGLDAAERPMLRSARRMVSLLQLLASRASFGETKGCDGHGNVAAANCFTDASFAGFRPWAARPTDDRSISPGMPLGSDPMRRRAGVACLCRRHSTNRSSSR